MTMDAFVENVPEKILNRVQELNDQLRGPMTAPAFNEALREYADIAFGHVEAYNRFNDSVKTLPDANNGFNARLNELIETSPNGPAFLEGLRERADDADFRDFFLSEGSLKEKDVQEGLSRVEDASREIYRNPNGGLRAFREMSIQSKDMTLGRVMEAPAKAIGAGPVRAEDILRPAKTAAKEPIPFEKHSKLTKTIEKANEKVQAASMAKGLTSPGMDAVAKTMPTVPAGR